MWNHSSNQILQQFHTVAVQQKLSAAAILLWQYIYFVGAGQNCYTELHLRTAEVQNALAITRNGLQKVRRALIDAGVLQVRIDLRQQVYYTLLIGNTPISESAALHAAAKKETEQSGQKHADQRQNSQQKRTKPQAKPYTPDSRYPGDIIQDGTYRRLIQNFCSQYDRDKHHQLEMSLYQFLHQRKQKGKTLTKAGLDAILEKLVQLSLQNVRTMIAIIEQSIRRGWTGVYAYTGSTGMQIRPQPAQTSYRRPSRIPAYDTAYVDLSFLER